MKYTRQWGLVLFTRSWVRGTVPAGLSDGALAQSAKGPRDE